MNRDGCCMSKSEKKRLVIPSRMAEMPAAQQQVLDAVVAAAYPKEALFAIRLCLDEAITNAIRHGNHEDPSKDVVIEYCVDDQKAEIAVTDQGPGFCPEQVPDPTRDECLSRPSGRGVMLMKEYMTDVSFNKTGNQVRMVKYKTCKRPKAG